jgi:inorganic triphosphatase YgiF
LSTPAGEHEIPEGTEPVEIEVKLSVTLPNAVARLLRHPDPERLVGFHADGPVRVDRVTDRYLDTHQTDGRLAAKIMRVRLRQHGRAVTLTVKRPGVERAGVTTRVELEGPATHVIDPDRWPDSDAKTALLAVVKEDKLGEIARVRQRRLVRVLAREDTRIELSLDTLDAIDRDHVVDRRHELEAELLDGDHDALVELGQALGRLDGVGPPIGSKLAFALAARATSRAAQQAAADAQAAGGAQAHRPDD